MLKYVRFENLQLHLKPCKLLIYRVFLFLGINLDDNNLPTSLIYNFIFKF